MQGRDSLFDLADAALCLAMTAVHGADHVTRTTLQPLDDLAYFNGVLGTLGKIAHLVGDHGKAATRFARAGGFDGRIERQQVGLLRYRADDFQYAANFLAATSQGFYFLHGIVEFTGQLLDAQCGFVNDLYSFSAGLVGTACCIGGLSGALCHILGGGAHFMECRGNLVDFAVLLLHAGTGLAGNLG